jgi:hypothetical protein
MFPQWVQDLNTGLSLLGVLVTLASFIITLIVFFEVKDIKNSFRRKAILPEITRDLSKTASSLSSSLGSWPEQKYEVISQIKIAISLLKSAKKILPKEEAQEIEKLILKLDRAVNASGDSRSPEAEAAWDLYSDIRSAVTTMEQLSKNTKWE